MDDEAVRHALETRVRQQAIISYLGQKALSEDAAQELIDLTTGMAAEGLRADAAAFFPAQVSVEQFREPYFLGIDLPADATFSLTESHSYYTTEANEPIIVADYNHEERFRDELLIGAGMQSGVCLPVRDRKHVFGVIGFFSAEGRTFDSDDIHFLQSAAHTLAAALNRRLMEQALRKSEALYRSTVNSLRSGIMVQDATNGTILLHNAGLEELLGASPADALFEKKHPDFISSWVSSKGETIAPNNLPWKKVLDNGTSLENITLGFSTPLGRKWVLVNSLVVEDDTTTHNSIVTSFSDITTLRLAEEQLRRFNQALEQRVAERTADLRELNKELESFSYSVSHDLQSPLRAIEKFAHIAQMIGADDPEELSEILQTINEKAKRSQELIKGLLAFSRLSRNTLSISRFAPKPMLLDLAQESIMSAGRQPEEISLSIDDLPPICADIGLFRQIWANLIGNAVKFSKFAQPAQIYIHGRQEAGSTILTIEDNGVGFDEAHAHKLFEVFHRLHGEDEFEGTGVGLAIVHKIVQKHGGTITAFKNSTGGATFTVSLPDISPSGT